MNKQELIKEKEELSRKKWRLEDEKKEAISKEIKELVAPIRDKANELECKIKDKYRDSYCVDLSSLSVTIDTIQAQIDEIIKQESASIWYAPGTIVCRWEKRSYTETYNMKEKGIVAIYDNDTPVSDNLRSYSLPKIGDIIVRILKKDGTPGKSFVVIGETRYNNTFELKYTAKEWLPEGQTKSATKNNQP